MQYGLCFLIVWEWLFCFYFDIFELFITVEKTKMLSLMNKLWYGARSQCPGVLLILRFFIVCRTFLHNMRAFGLNIEWCLEFLRKQSTIGNLSEGNYFIILL